jgi:hypothetical protein
MRKQTILLSAFALTLLGSAAVLAQAQQQAQPQQPMSFFVASTVPGTGNLGGLAGADKICEDLAATVGASNKVWHAYLSQEQRGNTPRVNARGRIGPGPWYNAKGVLIASNVADLHGDNQRDRNAIRQATALTEKGEIVAGGGGAPGTNQHDMLTGSDSMGRAFTDGLDHTCNNWTADSDTNRAMLGHHDRMGNANTSWNMAHMSQGCSKQALVNTGGAGKFYCFAVNQAGGG